MSKEKVISITSHPNFGTYKRTNKEKLQDVLLCYTEASRHVAEDINLLSELIFSDVAISDELVSRYEGKACSFAMGVQ